MWAAGCIFAELMTLRPLFQVSSGCHRLPGWCASARLGMTRSWAPLGRWRARKQLFCCRCTVFQPVWSLPLPASAARRAQSASAWARRFRPTSWTASSGSWATPHPRTGRCWNTCHTGARTQVRGPGCARRSHWGVGEAAPPHTLFLPPVSIQPNARPDPPVCSPPPENVRTRRPEWGPPRLAEHLTKVLAAQAEAQRAAGRTAAAIMGV